MHPLRQFIKVLLEEERSKKSEKKREDEELLTEPDETEGRSEKEISSGGVAGVSVPLGATASYPGRSKMSFPSSKVAKKNSRNG
tara:strand:- start:908 stop:1159 length:252 start_codon:yes stop_codon:yes gene_type:complete